MAAPNHMPDVEKDHAGSGSINGGYDLHHDHHDPDTALRRLRTAGSISITPELFEKIYLSPKNRVSNNIRSTFGNPTPLALCGFLLSLTPLSNILLGWRGAGGLGAAEVGVYYFFGGLLMILGGFLEFILGNTFPFVVFGSFGAFWLSFGATLTPYFNASIAYDPTHPAASSTNPTFAATFAYFHVYMGVLCFVYMVCAIRTNIIFVLIFATLVAAFGCLAAFFFQVGEGVANLGLQHAAGGITFVTCLLGWYLFLVQLLAAVDFPINLPVGDLSRFIPGASDRAKAE
ncbi:hypothetical protein LTR92_004374 [Exophiala xenobiotica]|nr:hypothetical protein LTR92_004374 [Exophiala xenobiotica]